MQKTQSRRGKGEKLGTLGNLPPAYMKNKAKGRSPASTTFLSGPLDVVKREKKDKRRGKSPTVNIGSRFSTLTDIYSVKPSSVLYLNHRLFQYISSIIQVQ